MFEIDINKMIGIVAMTKSWSSQEYVIASIEPTPQCSTYYKPLTIDFGTKKYRNKGEECKRFGLQVY